MEQYKIQMEQYKIQMEQYKIQMKQYKIQMEQYKIQMEQYGLQNKELVIKDAKPFFQPPSLTKKLFKKIFLNPESYQKNFIFRLFYI